MFKTLIFVLFFSVSFSEVWGGYTIFTPQQAGFGTTSYLLDTDGNTVNTWSHSNGPASMPYLYPDSTILYPYQVPNPTMVSGGVGGGIQIIDWDGNILWDFEVSDQNYQHHHDVHPLPNGNILVVAWEKKTSTEAYAMGRQTINNSLNQMWSEVIFELEPVGSNDANIVWEWHLWDHLIQDVSTSYPNYGDPSENPQLFDINEGNAGSSGGPGGANGDWFHINAIDYNSDLDQIAFSSRHHDEIFIIDHSTTTEEAASHNGGNCGKGGDFLYRWGNPQNYGQGDTSDRQLNDQHSVNWIPSDYPGGGNLILFNNSYANNNSAIFEWETTINEDGCYDLNGDTFGPDEPLWVYTNNFHSNVQSGAFRLGNGNTLITDANSTRIFEVNADGDIEWNYYHPGNSEMIPRAQKYPIDFFSASYTPGDVNDDGLINILDVVSTVNIVLGMADFTPAADFNGDGIVNVLDIVSIVNVILGS